MELTIPPTENKYIKHQKFLMKCVKALTLLEILLSVIVHKICFDLRFFQLNITNANEVQTT